MRLIVRKERPHPGAQLRITDLDGHRIAAFVTNTTRGQLADLDAALLVQPVLTRGGLRPYSCAS
jgi:hypothetical protein